MSSMSLNGHGSRAVAIVLASVLVSGCRKKDAEPPWAAATALPSAAAQMAPDAPYVRVFGNVVALDGTAVSTTRVIEEMGRMQELDGLRDALKTKRDALRAARPSSPFAGQVVLECPPEASALVFKSLFQTIANAGFPHIVVRTSPASFVAVEGSPPAVPIFGEQPPDKRVDVNAEDGKVEVIRTEGATVGTRWSVPLGQREALAAKMAEDLKREPLVGPERDLSLHAANGLPFGTLAAVVDGLHAARLQLPQRSGGRYAFRIVLSAR